MNDQDLEALGEHLYQLSLGKLSTDTIDELVDAADQLWPNLQIGTAASYALALSELRQDLAKAESNRDMRAATGYKRKIDLLEDILLGLIEKIRSGNRVTEANSKIGVKNQKVDLYAGEKLADEIEPELVDMIQQAYAKVGGNPKIKEPGDLSREYSDWIVMDVDEDPEVDVAIFGQPGRRGMKIGASAQDGTLAAKNALTQLKGQLMRNGWWAEVSDAPAHIAMNKLGLKPLEDEEMVRDLLAGKNIEWHGEHPEGKFPGTKGWYTRLIGGEPHAKIIVGDV